MEGSAALQDALQRYESFDGARVLDVGLRLGASGSESCAWVEMRAYRVADGDSIAGWRIVRVTAIGHPLFSWKELPRDSNAVPNWPASLVEVDGRVVIDFDPLHGLPIGGDTVISHFAIGGDAVLIEEIGDWIESQVRS